MYRLYRRWFLNEEDARRMGQYFFEGKDDYLRMDYGTTTPILWSALQYALTKIDKLEKEVKALKGKGKGKSDSE